MQSHRSFLNIHNFILEYDLSCELRDGFAIHKYIGQARVGPHTEKASVRCSTFYYAVVRESHIRLKRWGLKNTVVHNKTIPYVTIVRCLFPKRR